MMKIVQSQQQTEVQHRLESSRELRWVARAADTAPSTDAAQARQGAGPAETVRAEPVPMMHLGRRVAVAQTQALVFQPGELSTSSAALHPLEFGFGEGDEETRWDLLLLAKTLEQLTGRTINLFAQPLLVPPERLQQVQADFQALQVAQSQEPVVDMPQPDGLLLQERVSEFEQLKARFSGQVLTESGEQHHFQVELKLERAIEGLAWREARMQDPLVIQLDNQPLSLSEERFAFDLSADGVEELIPKLGAGYGLLALDRNNDGQINNGSELFGTQSGNGFADLAAFDEDGNGFIDSGDSAYQRLLVWRDPGNGAEPQLLGLAEVGVDAISLQAVATPFRLTDQLGDTLGQLRSSAVTLGESARLIHQIDFSL